MSEYKIELLKKEDEQKWQDYVFSSKDTSFFHLIEWKKILKNSYGYEPFYLMAEDNNEKIVGIFPIFLVKSLFFGKSLKSLPFHFLGGPVFDSIEILNKLLERTKILTKELNVKNFLVKSYDDYANIRVCNINLIKTYISFIIPLLKIYEEVYKTFSKNIQRDIKYGMRDNKVILVDDLEKLKIFYNLFVKSNKEIGLPAHDFRLFKNLWEIFYPQKMVRVSIAKFRDKFIAAHFALLFKNKILYMWGAIDRKYKKRLGMQTLQDESIRWGCQNGYRYYDFGWTSPVEKGSLYYKSRWGTFQKKVYFCSFYKPLQRDYDYHTSLNVPKFAWSQMPLKIARIVGPFLAKQAG